jgi:hypothetical protein
MKKQSINILILNAIQQLFFPVAVSNVVVVVASMAGAVDTFGFEQLLLLDGVIGMRVVSTVVVVAVAVDVMIMYNKVSTNTREKSAQFSMREYRNRIVAATVAVAVAVAVSDEKGLDSVW